MRAVGKWLGGPSPYASRGECVVKLALAAWMEHLQTQGRISHHPPVSPCGLTGVFRFVDPPTALTSGRPPVSARPRAPPSIHRAALLRPSRIPQLKKSVPEPTTLSWKPQDLVSRTLQLIKRRSRTLFTSPSIINMDNVFDPPALMKGSGMPVTGIRPITMPTLTRM